MSHEPLLPLWPAPEPVSAPWQGSTTMTRESSHSGAVHATQGRGEKVAALRQLFREPLTLNEAAAITGWPINSVCSLRNAIKDDLEEVDKEIVEWGPGKKPTTRTRWRLKKAVNGGER